MKIYGKENIRDYLYENSNDKNYHFSQNLSELVEYNECEKELKELLQEDTSVEYPALYSLLTLYRKTNRRDEISDLLEKYFTKYRNSPIMWYFRSYIEKSYDVLGAIEDAKKAIDIIEDPTNKYDPKYPGFHNHYAELLTLYSMELSDTTEAIGYLEEALKTIKLAIKHEPKYPTYKANQSKIYKELGKHFEKEKETAKAISNYNNGITSINDGIKNLEVKSKSVDYVHRFNEYYKIFIELSALKNSAEMKIMLHESSSTTLEDIKNFISHEQKKLHKEQKSLEKVKDEVSSEKIKTIESLAFFSGVISFVLTTANSAMSDKFILKEKSFLICLMAACLIYVFCAFDIIISRKFKLKNFIFYILASLIPVAGCTLSWFLL